MPHTSLLKCFCSVRKKKLKFGPKHKATPPNRRPVRPVFAGAVRRCGTFWEKPLIFIEIQRNFIGFSRFSCRTSHVFYPRVCTGDAEKFLSVNKISNPPDSAAEFRRIGPNRRRIVGVLENDTEKNMPKFGPGGSFWKFFGAIMLGMC